MKTYTSSEIAKEYEKLHKKFDFKIKKHMNDIFKSEQITVISKELF